MRSCQPNSVQVSSSRWGDCVPRQRWQTTVPKPDVPPGRAMLLRLRPALVRGEDLRHLPLILGCHNHEYEFSGFTSVGSEEARMRAGLRPPLKLHVRFSRMQLSRRLTDTGMPEKVLNQASAQARTRHKAWP